MPAYLVEETQRQWVTHHYNLNAESKLEAQAKVASGQVDHHDVDYGEYFGECSYKVTQLDDDEPEPPQGIDLEAIELEVLRAFESLVISTGKLDEPFLLRCGPQNVSTTVLRILKRHLNQEGALSVKEAPRTAGGEGAASS